jgi:hypothetical protein
MARVGGPLLKLSAIGGLAVFAVVQARKRVPGFRPVGLLLVGST